MKNFLQEFLKLFQFSGYILIIVFFIAIIWANLNNSYFLIFQNKFVHFFINEILMTLFFLLVGLEIKREFLVGHLSGFKKALLPIILAFFGAITPAIIFVLINYNNFETLRGWGIPMATDIAFAFLIISLSNISYSLKITLLSIAVIDDMIAVIVIGIFYSSGFNVFYLFLILLLALILFFISKFFYKDFIFLISLIPAWFLFYKSGIHPSISGIFISLFVKLESLEIWEDKLDNVVNLFILPVFILGNSGIKLSDFKILDLFNSLSLGIILGLLLGKQIGITFSAFIFKKLRIVDFPKDIKIYDIWAMSIVCAIGFTMSIFISELAFHNNKKLLEISKASVFIASFLSAIFGLIVLKFRQFF